MKRRTAAIDLALALAILVSTGLGPAPATGQENACVVDQTTVPCPRGGIRVDAGLAQYGQSDLMASPLRYHGAAPQFEVGYRWVGERTRFEIAGSFSSFGLESEISDGGSRAEAAFGTLRSRWLRRVSEKLYWEGFLGVGVDVLVPFRRQTYPPNGQTELFGDAFIPLLAVAAHELRLTPRMVAWQALAIPLAGVVVRSPYTGLKSLPDADLSPPGRFIGLDHVLGVDYGLASSWSWVAEWRFTALRYPDPREIAFATHRWTFGLEVRL